jgi:hypothetical protein
MDISIARYNKGNDSWYKSIDYFLKAKKLLEKLETADKYETTRRYST